MSPTVEELNGGARDPMSPTGEELNGGARDPMSPKGEEAKPPNRRESHLGELNR